jgi:ADP-ribose pyrophosphatase YjhB (NUDIX family)
MKFCSACGASVTLQIPDGDNRERFVCITCETIHYQNPRVIAGCLPIWEDRVLLCLRDIDPRSGYWTLPAGFHENQETTAQGAARETSEEANARVKNLELYTVFSLPHISQIYMFFRAELADLDFSAGHETQNVALFEEKDIPWDQLAFPVITRTLEQYFVDRQRTEFQVLYEEIEFRRRR